MLSKRVYYLYTIAIYFVEKLLFMKKNNNRFTYSHIVSVKIKFLFELKNNFNKKYNDYMLCYFEGSFSFQL